MTMQDASILLLKGETVTSASCKLELVSAVPEGTPPDAPQVSYVHVRDAKGKLAPWIPTQEALAASDWALASA